MKTQEVKTHAANKSDATKPAATKPDKPAVNSHERADYTLRDRVMKVLSDDEVAVVSTAETKSALVNGDEYLDLEHLDKGVLTAPTGAPPMGRVLPRKAVQAATWGKLLAALRPVGSERKHPTT